MAMNGPGKEHIDPWTGMPIGVDSDVNFVTAAPKSKPWAQSVAGFGDLFWKLMAARSHATPPEVLSCLAVDGSVNVRKFVAENRNSPPDVLALLSEDMSENVRAAVARNNSTPNYLLNRLSDDPNPKVRFAIASNESMADSILLGLFMDPDPFVADRASQSLEH